MLVTPDYHGCKTRHLGNLNTFKMEVMYLYCNEIWIGPVLIGMRDCTRYMET